MSNEPNEHPDATDDADAERTERIEGAARPEQPRRESFAEGEAHPDEFAGEDHIGRFSEGEEALDPTTNEEHVGRFSEGEEQLGEEDPEKHVEGSFSSGVDDVPPDKSPERPL